VASRKKKDLPVFTVVDMPKWKTKILDVITSVLFPGQRYFVITLNETGFTTNGKGKYKDTGTGVEIDLSN
jgi:hypothetical protein